MVIIKSLSFLVIMLILVHTVCAHQTDDKIGENVYIHIVEENEGSTTSFPLKLQKVAESEKTGNILKSQIRKNGSRLHDFALNVLENEIDATNLTPDLLKWEAPLYVQTSFPYYQAGFDDEGRPVWVSEFGKYPLVEVANSSEEQIRILRKYIKQAILRMLISIKAQNVTRGEVNDAYFIVDVDGFPLALLSNQKAISLILSFFQTYKNYIVTYTGGCTIINANYVAEMAINVLRPLLGNVMEKVEVYGTNRQKWMSILRRKVQQDSLPTLYGGPVDFKPLQVYG